MKHSMQIHFFCMGYCIALVLCYIAPDSNSQHLQGLDMNSTMGGFKRKNWGEHRRHTLGEIHSVKTVSYEELLQEFRLSDAYGMILESGQFDRIYTEFTEWRYEQGWREFDLILGHYFKPLGF